MSSQRLKPLYPSKFLTWVTRSGFTDEFHFWSYLSGINSRSIADHQNHYLTSLGYTGTIVDKMRNFLKDQTSLNGTIWDTANQFFNVTFSGAADGLITESGEQILTEGGDPLVEE